MKNKDTFTLWGVQCNVTKTIRSTHLSRQRARLASKIAAVLCKPVKLECRIVEQRPKKPKKPKTFKAYGLEWIPHTPGDPRPCAGDKQVRILQRVENTPSFISLSQEAKDWDWGKTPENFLEEEIIGWNYADAK